MSDIFESLFSLFKHFDKFFHWLHEALKFYTQPKLFIESILNLKTKDIIKRILEYFCFFETILLIIASTLIDKIQFSLYKIPGLLILDAIFALPLIIVISIALFFARVVFPIKKSVSFVLLMKIFYGLPIQIFLFFFISFENYVFYVLFGAGIQLLFLFLLLVPPLFFAEKKKQSFIILGITLGLLILYIFTYEQASKVNPPSENMDSEESYFDPIFSEYRTYRAKVKLIDEMQIKDEIEKAESYSKQIENNDIEINVDKLREDQKYHTEFVLSRIKSEAELFNKENNCYFRNNKKRYELYLDYLNELSRYQEKYYSVFDIFDLGKAMKNNQIEIELLTRKLENSPKYIITEFSKIDYSKIKSEKELINRLETEDKMRELAIEQKELQIKILEKENSKWENKVRIQEIISDIFSEATKLEESRLKFSEDEMYYYIFISKLRSLIFF